MENVILEKKFKYKGITCAVVFTKMGHRCGYVLLPPEHKYFEANGWDMDIEVHGGITYSSSILQASPEVGWWIGFDCIHLYDKPDLKSFKKYYDILEDPEACRRYANIIIPTESEEGVVWTKKMVKKEIKHLVDQLIKIK